MQYLKKAPNWVITIKSHLQFSEINHNSTNINKHNFKFNLFHLFVQQYSLWFTNIFCCGTVLKSRNDNTYFIITEHVVPLQDQILSLNISDKFLHHTENVNIYKPFTKFKLTNLQNKFCKQIHFSLVWGGTRQNIRNILYIHSPNYSSLWKTKYL